LDNTSDRDIPDDTLQKLSLVPFGDWKEALDGSGLLSSDYDELAKKFHIAFTQNNTKAAVDAAVDLEWDYLEEEYRVSNRRVAAHMRAILDASGYDLDRWLSHMSIENPRLSSDIPSHDESSDFELGGKLEKLADLQHTRWMIDRSLNGWRYGNVRDNSKRLHNCMVPYESLSEENKDKDRQMVKLIETLLKDG
jgi:hypothetical protein